MRADFLLAACLSVASMGGATGPALEVTVPSDTPRVGDRLPVRVTARGGEDLMWGELRVVVEDAGSWALVDGPRELTGARPPAWELVLAPMEVGELVVPAMAAGVRDAAGEPGEIRTENLPTVTVTSVLPTDQEVQPAPLRDPLGVSGFPWEWVVPLAVPLLGMALAFAWWGRRLRHREVVSGTRVLDPLEELGAMLDRLDERVGREPAESICDRLAGGLRRYLERTSGQPAEEMTSFELRLLARRQQWPDPIQRGIQTVMAMADRVRFGRMAADERELRQAIETTRQTAGSLEDHLKPVDEEPEDLEAAG